MRKNCNSWCLERDRILLFAQLRYRLCVPWVSRVWRPTRHNIGHFGGGCCATEWERRNVHCKRIDLYSDITGPSIQHSTSANISSRKRVKPSANWSHFKPVGSFKYATTVTTTTNRQHVFIPGRFQTRLYYSIGSVSCSEITNHRHAQTELQKHRHPQPQAV